MAVILRQTDDGWDQTVSDEKEQEFYLESDESPDLRIHAQLVLAVQGRSRNGAWVVNTLFRESTQGAYVAWQSITFPDGKTCAWWMVDDVSLLPPLLGWDTVTKRMYAELGIQTETTPAEILEGEVPPEDEDLPKEPIKASAPRLH